MSPLQVTVPQNYLYLQALGAALLSQGRTSRVSLLPGKDSRQSYFETPRLPDIAVPDGQTGYTIEKPSIGYLGVDVGSTSTKAVIISDSGETVLAKHYLMTAGRPVDAIKEVFRNLLARVGEHATIAGVGITGSGRYLVGSFVGADLIRNEITAQTRAAAEIDIDADLSR